MWIWLAEEPPDLDFSSRHLAFPPLISFVFLVHAPAFS
ncbi:hypothetical protein [Corynebacterium phage LGCM-V6]|nr:hypothetical protein LGCMVI_0017 [Corynebacterium phage LGCM-VI]ARM68549.1 hypothetical protein [Corynebacterium phage LGCM-V2]ARM68597.1 hypothetical protein [Corynebacterium phage LGCM-V3]ARM68646.1 hypothetical protein [Corynebacterium phage LGCM-V4]ARM68694.1 hypothetical protein [Corynebacterium phage LGCM-V6]ARM68742.1 hypothetical protein [Corynebacterium phage LGCM-V5]ARM68790.1 hypothetical protein [Corynebacterium phage LGCM-V7]ARM68838.1 hypothetical protein [Corynebacterium ph